MGSYGLLGGRGNGTQDRGGGGAAHRARFVEDLCRQLKDGVVRERRAEQHRAERPAVGRDAKWNGDTQEVEQVSEMGVVTKHRVAVDGPGEDFVDGEGGA